VALRHLWDNRAMEITRFGRGLRGPALPVLSLVRRRVGGAGRPAGPLYRAAPSRVLGRGRVLRFVPGRRRRSCRAVLVSLGSGSVGRGGSSRAPRMASRSLLPSMPPSTARPTEAYGRAEFAVTRYAAEVKGMRPLPGSCPSRTFGRPLDRHLRGGVHRSLRAQRRGDGAAPPTSPTT